MTPGASTSPAVVPASQPYSATSDAVIDELGSDREQGLSQVEAGRRLAEHGRNEIAAEKRRRWWPWLSLSCGIR